MKNLTLLFLILLIQPAFGQSFSAFERHAFINEKADTLVYRLLPPLVNQVNKKFPLVIFLHGAGERGNDNEKQLVHGASLFLNEQNRKTFPAYVFFPQCPESDYWASVAIDRSTYPLQLDFDYSRPITKSLRLVIELINRSIHTMNVDTSRIYIVGLSMGGMGTFEAVYQHTNLFAAAAPICGGGDVERYAAQKTTLPFWIFHGSADSVVEVKHSRQMAEVLNQLSTSFQYTEYEGVGHNSWENTFAEKEFLPWLFAQKRL